MRVIAGSARHCKLVAPEGRMTRPTLDSIRETLFNMIRDHLPGAVFADLFAGSGAIGIEALSRGAAKAYFYETNSAALKCLIQNLQTTGLSGKAQVFKSDVIKSLKRIREERVDLVYVDPPFDASLYRSALSALSGMPYIRPDTLIICEAEIREDFSFAPKEGFTVVREKCYKHNKHVFLQLSATGEHS